MAASAAVVAAQQCDVGNSLAAARRQGRRQQRQRRWRQREARRQRTAGGRQRGGSSAEAAADFPAPSVNAPMHTPLNATDALTYASSSLVKVGGPAQKMTFFQVVQKSFLSVPIYCFRCKYDSLVFFFKNIAWNLSVECVKHENVGSCRFSYRFLPDF